VSSRKRTGLDLHIDRYLKHFRALGRGYFNEERTLQSLTTFLVKRREYDLRADLFDAWCRTFVTLSANTRRLRQLIVRKFCLYRQRAESRCYVPDINRFARPIPHATPVILTTAQISQLLRLTGECRPTPHSPLYPHILRLAIVLFYTAGLRRGELVKLTLSDVDMKAGVLRVRESKFNKSRWVPLSLDARRELRRYLKYRLIPPLGVGPESPLLCNLSRGTRARAYTGTGLGRGITELMVRAGIHDAQGRIPRVHDFRHTFAVHALLRWYRQGADVQSQLPKLALYMGHVSIASTAYYLRWIPEIQELASERFAQRFGDLVHGEQL
jgi:integrase/recombinase XerD